MKYDFVLSPEDFELSPEDLVESWIANADEPEDVFDDETEAKMLDHARRVLKG